MATVDTVITSILWLLFGHYSQTFDWLAIYVWMTNDFRVDKPATRSLIYMPLFRWLGDLVHKIISEAAPGSLANASIPAPLWYAGEIWGDFYIPAIALAMLPSHAKFARVAVYCGYSLFALNKVANCIWRLYVFGIGGGEVMFFNGVSILDSATCWTGAISDLICCYVIYTKTEEMSRVAARSAKSTGALSNIFDLLKNSSLIRIYLMVSVKILNGAFFVTHLCGAFETVCPYGFLRGVITTVDYQLYYMDYLLAQFMKHADKSRNASQTQSGVKSHAESQSGKKNDME